ncbi:hypothetical protein R6Q59_028433 [Mikania micrantha]
MPAPETLYDLLGVSENGTLSDIKHAYKKMALKYHPDVSPPDRAEEYTVRFIRISSDICPFHVASGETLSL